MPTIKKRASASKKQSGQEIAAITGSVSAFMAANRKVITIVLSCFAAAVLLAWGFSLKCSLDEQNAGPLFASAYDTYSQAAGSNGDYAKALGLFRNVQKKYPGSISGAAAAYYAGNCLMAAGRNDDALKEYQSFVKEYGSRKLLLGLVYQRMGYLYLQLGNQAEAIKAFEQSDVLSGPGLATIELARLYESAGNGTASQMKYKIISEKLTGTAWAAEAMGKVQKISPLAAPPSAQKGNK